MTLLYLADLTHNWSCIASEVVPLNIGVLGSYTKKVFGEAVELRLFKYPDELLQAMHERRPDVLGVSNYNWNRRLAEWACRKAKELDPNTLTVKGGWNLPLDNAQRRDFLLEDDATDIYVVNEGERGLQCVLERFLEHGRDGVLRGPVDGCIWLDRKSGELISGPPSARMRNLEEIPSPYQTGLLDEFLDGRLIPLIETTRGCPFQCDFCATSIDYYSKIARFPVEYIRGDLEYICDRIKDRGNNQLLLADSNLGMYPQDKIVMQMIADIGEEHGWPRNVHVTGSGKNKIDHVLDALAPLNKMLTPQLAFQSFNRDTLEEIKRSNISSVSFDVIAKKAAERGFTIHSELIAPLPRETLESYFEGVRTLMDCGPKKITSYTLNMLLGTVYRLPEYVEKHGYVSKYRVIPNSVGWYDDELVLEADLAGVESRYMSFDDYLAVRRFTLYTELIYNNDVFEELFKFLAERGFSAYELMAKVRVNFDKSDGPLAEIRESFVHDTCDELRDTEEDLIALYAQPEIRSALQEGAYGGNVTFKHKAWVLAERMSELASFVVTSAQELIAERYEGAELVRLEGMLDSIHRFSQAKLFDVLDDSDVDAPVSFESDHDLLAWLSDPDKRPMEHFGTPTVLHFAYSEERKKIKRNYLDQYGRTLRGRTRILAKVAVLQSLFREPECLSS